METKEKRKFNKRAFISTALLITFMILPFSGLRLHTLSFDMFDTEKHFWMAMHNMAATLFCIFLITHLIYNKKILISYAKKAKGILISKEAFLALMIVVFIIGVFSMHALHVR